MSLLVNKHKDLNSNKLIICNEFDTLKYEFRFIFCICIEYRQKILIVLIMMDFKFLLHQTKDSYYFPSYFSNKEFLKNHTLLI